MIGEVVLDDGDVEVVLATVFIYSGLPAGNRIACPLT